MILECLGDHRANPIANTPVPSAYRSLSLPGDFPLSWGATLGSGVWGLDGGWTDFFFYPLSCYFGYKRDAVEEMGYVGLAALDWMDAVALWISR